MRTDHLKRFLALLAPLALLIAWAIVIWVALHVSTIVLETLDMIVELAAISP
jgi:cytosine/uracil/thiamine/allantoin permease